MSLINDVLRDLERRKAPEAAITPDAVERPGERSQRGFRFWPLWLLAAIGLGAILHLSLSNAPKSPGGTQAPTFTARAASAAVTQANSAPESARADSAASTLPSDAQPVTPREDARTAQAFGDDKITAKALVTPSDPESKPGDGADRAPSHARDDQHGRRAADRSPRESATTSAPKGAGKAPNAAPDEPAGSSISIRRADGDDAGADPLLAIRRMLARGQFQRAESRLRQLVEQQPQLTEAYELLAGTLMRNRRHEAAARLLERGVEKARDPAALAALLGRLLIEDGEPARARGILQAHAPALSDDPDYHLLLAAAHRQAGDHAAAAEHYRALTGVVPGSGAAWIGLGASLESLDRPVEAAGAYDQALDGDDGRAARFARQRLSALAPIIGEGQ